MNLFDQLVDKALKNTPQFSTLRAVVEKELLHHDILRVLSHNNLLNELTFIGGTCLRTCYGGVRLSEDLDFAGGADFTRNSLAKMSSVLIENLVNKYGLSVQVSEPKIDKNNVDTWKVKVETRQKSKHLPMQRINIDICAVPSYDRKPMMLLNPYGVDMGTSGLIVQAQSKEEIYTDKIVAFALRPNRIKFRDLWDIMWLHQQRIVPHIDLIWKKLNDRSVEAKEFLSLYGERVESLESEKSLLQGFLKEMTRFLPSDQVKIDANLWQFIIHMMKEHEKSMLS